MIEPVENIIPRTLDNDISNLLKNFSIKIDETVNLGSNIIAWDMQANKGGDENLPILLFLRNYLEQIDACSILVNSASSEPVHILLRIALENFFYIEYLLESDFEKRSLCFLVYNAYKTQSFYEKVDGKSSSYLDLVNIYERDKILSKFKPIILPDIDQQKKNSLEFLNLPKYKDISKEYQRKSKKRKRPEWYSLYNGPNNIKELADHLKYPAFYKILYQSLSASTHGTNIIQGKLATGENNIVSIYQIRLPLNIEFLVKACITLSFVLYDDFINARIPEKAGIVKNWYVQLKPFHNSLDTNLIEIE
jgi:hypothetical protein